MQLANFFRSHLNKALIFFCIGFLLKEPMNLVLWLNSGVFVALHIIDGFLEKGD